MTPSKKIPPAEPTAEPISSAKLAAESVRKAALEIDVPKPSPGRPPGYDVFISHSSKDKTAADTACHALEARDIRCWIAPRDIRPGANWGEAILDAISSVRVMVLVLSAHANSSPQIQREVERAVHHGVIVIPMRIEEVIPIKSLEYFLSTSHWLDAFQPPLQRHLAHLADTIQGVLGQEITRSSTKDASSATTKSGLAPWMAAGAVALAVVAFAGWWWQSRQTEKSAASSVATPVAADHSPGVVLPMPAPTAKPTVAPTAAPTATSAAIASDTPPIPAATPAPTNPPVYLKPRPTPDEASQRRDAYLRARDVDQQLNAAWKSLYNYPRLRSANREQLVKIENQWLSRRSAQTGGPELLSRYEHGEPISLEYFRRFTQMDIEQTEWLRTQLNSLR